jgi:hypothetical protein
VGQAEVEQEEVGLVVEGEDLGGGATQDDGVALGFEGAHEPWPDRRVVFDEPDGCHSRSFTLPLGSMKGRGPTLARMRRGITPAVLVVLAVVGLGACASKGTPTASSPSTTAGSGSTSSPSSTCASSTTVAGSKPGAPESSPPGDIPDNQAFVAYSPPSGLYTIKVPEGWARSETATAVTFSDKFNSITIDTAAPPAESAPCFASPNVTNVTRKAGPAVLTRYQADSPADPVTGKVVRDDVERYEFSHGGTTVVLTLAGSSGSDNVDPWRIVTDSFAWR